MPVMTAHLVLADPSRDPDEVRRNATQMLADRFHIGHATLQVEASDCGIMVCMRECSHNVRVAC
jgi:cobalt-zinc-cadmium efflux system protein